MNKNLVVKAFSESGIEINEEQGQQFVIYYNMLIEWNEKINLTAITDPNEVITKHFIDSVLSCKVIDYSKVETLIDIGTGAGFPGIPLKIVYPHLNVTLVDALNKRIHYLELVIETLELKDIVAVHGRAEDLARTDLRESFDLCVSRAVSQLNVLCEYCLPFIKIGGIFLSYKGSKTLLEVEESHNAIAILGGVIKSVADDIVLDHDTERGFVRIEKIDLTDIRYPRRAGKPLKKPL